jgi:hypothetical protein
MRRCFAMAVALFAWPLIGFIPQARAQDELPCNAFYRNPDGSWTATQNIFIPGTKMVSRVGGVFRPGALVEGRDLAAILDKTCPNPGVAPPTAPQLQQSSVPLLKSADANGVLDVAGLSCGQVADAADWEADLLLAWYGGSLAPAKNRRFNMPRLRSAIQNVVAFCKVHRDAKLVKVMDSMLK